jgi:hypothetical protein
MVQGCGREVNIVDCPVDKRSIPTGRRCAAHRKESVICGDNREFMKRLQALIYVSMRRFAN